MTFENKKPILKFAILATDVVCFKMIDKQLSVLLCKVKNTSPFVGKWALIGGLILPEETTDKSVERHLLEKAGIDNVYKEQLYTFSEINRDPRGRVVSVAYFSLIKEDSKQEKETNFETKWFPVKDLPELAYDHNKIVDCAVERLKSKIAYTNISQFLLPDEFTLSKLQSIYEHLIGKSVDKRNFRRKILDVEILKDTGKVQKQGVMRPAVLYKFSSKEIKYINTL